MDGSRHQELMGAFLDLLRRPDAQAAVRDTRFRLVRNHRTAKALSQTPVCPHVPSVGSHVPCVHALHGLHWAAGQ